MASKGSAWTTSSPRGVLATIHRRSSLARTLLREEMFVDYLLCAPLSHESFVLFTDAVLPRIA